MGRNKSSDDSSESSSDDDRSSVSSDSSDDRKRKSHKEKSRKKSTHHKSRKSRDRRKKSRSRSDSSDSEDRKHRRKSHKRHSRSRSRSRGKSKQHIPSKRLKEDDKKAAPSKPMTEEEIQKEAERKKQIRLAKARALKFENELAERAETAPVIQPVQPTQVTTQPIQTTIPTPTPTIQSTPTTQPTQIIPPPFIQKLEEKKEKKSPEKDMIEEKKKEIEEEPIPEEPKKKKPGYMDELESDEEETVKETNQMNGASKVDNDDDDIDPLDAFMSTIEKEAVKQVSFKLTDIIPGREDDTNVRMEIDHSKVITFEDLQHLQKEAPPEANGHQADAMEDEEDEEDRKFRQALLEAVKGEKRNEEPEPAADADTKKKGERQIMDDDLGDQMYMETRGEIDDDTDFVARQKKMADKKELKLVDHSQINYEPFRKNFYIETREIRELTDEQVEEIRKDLGDIKVRGDCPKPIQNWYQCGLTNKLLHVLIEKKKFLEPFPIQAQAIPAIMSGKDVIGIAETGSGKTLAYLLPMFRHILDQRPLEEGEGPIGLIMAPTRELAWQIYLDAKKFTKATDLRCVCVYGGAGVAGQLSELKRGAEIVVCTPGRMIDVLTTSNGKITNLRRVTYIVLDEADRMLDLGFEPQISKILQNVRPNRQTVMFSATFPKNIENLAKKILNKPVEIVVGQRGKTAGNIEQIVEVRSEETKFLRLLEILGEWSDKGSILIFVDKQVDADNLFKELLKFGYFPLLLHGGQDQVDRDGTISDFKKGVRTLMVATSVCARGLDVPAIVLVINYKCPNHREDYVHRIGRTGRAGRKGTAITFITPEEDQYAVDLINALKQSNITPPEDLMQLSRNYLMKIEKGEAKMYTNRNMQGSGFRFDNTEKNKAKEAKKAVRRQFGIELDFSDEAESDEDVVTKKETKQATEKKDEQLNLQLIKDPNTKAAVMQAATKAAKDVIMAGGTSEDVLQAAQHAIKAILQQYRPANTVEQGLEQVLKIRDEVEAREEESGDLFSAELEINDYPQNARNKISNKDFLTSIHDLTGCSVTVRGLYCDPTKKVPLGQKKLHLHIVGPSKFDVVAAHKEIKRELEDYARLSLNTGHVGKYKIGQ